jgi:hypothetical protein
LVLFFLADLTKALVGNTDPNDPVGVDVARIGLGTPSRPMLVGETPRPFGPGMAHDTGLFLFVSPLY